MAKTVHQAFEMFMKDSVNLDPNIVAQARNSKNNLLDNIKEFDSTDGFFHLYSDVNIQFGSFARRTKCRELDDIDLMIGISGEGATYKSNNSWNNVQIIASKCSSVQQYCTNDDGTLNSTKVMNVFKNKLSNVREYSRSEIKKTGEAIRLNLISKKWSFDIVPCFYTEPETDGRQYYLIPDGNGAWKKTDPRIDRDTVAKVNQQYNGKVVELIRLCKKWNRVKHVYTMPSYLLETMLVNYFENYFKRSSMCTTKNCEELFCDALEYIMHNVTKPILDMKEIQGDINKLSVGIRNQIANSARIDMQRGKQAIWNKLHGNEAKAIVIWQDIFGKEFPNYD